jgi:hypothetical protein
MDNILNSAGVEKIQVGGHNTEECYDDGDDDEEDEDEDDDGEGDVDHHNEACAAASATAFGGNPDDDDVEVDVSSKQKISAKRRPTANKLLENLRDTLILSQLPAHDSDSATVATTASISHNTSAPVPMSGYERKLKSVSASAPVDMWPNDPIMIRRSVSMLPTHIQDNNNDNQQSNNVAKIDDHISSCGGSDGSGGSGGGQDPGVHLMTEAERRALTLPLRIHQLGEPELSEIAIESDLFVGKAYVLVADLPDSPTAHFR